MAAKPRSAELHPGPGFRVRTEIQRPDPALMNEFRRFATPDISDLLNRLFAVTRVFRVGVLVVAIIMLVSAAALIGNTVRLAVFNRRKEIGIMRLVGATSWHIRMPFLIEGTIEGLLGAGAAILGLFIMKVSFIDPLRGKVGFLPLVGTQQVLSTVPWLLGAGVLVAGVASWLAMRLFLEV